jgi:hypothetical protein
LVACGFPAAYQGRRKERRLRWEEERRVIDEMHQLAIQQRTRELQAQALVQNKRVEFAEQNPGQ